MSMASGPPWSTTRTARGVNPLLFRPPISRRADGSFIVRLNENVRDVLASLPEQLRALLAEDSPNLVRLFPPAYLANDENEAEYRRLMRDDLLATRVASLDVLERTARAKTLTADELDTWSRCLNDVRLVVGTALDVTDDDMHGLGDLREDDPRIGALQLYELLGWLLQHAIEAMLGRSEPPSGGEVSTVNPNER